MNEQLLIELMKTIELQTGASKDLLVIVKALAKRIENLEKAHESLARECSTKRPDLHQLWEGSAVELTD